MVNTCSIPLCSSVSSKEFNIKLHKFPVSEEIRNLWIKSILGSHAKFKVGSQSFICSKHFLPTDYIVSARSKSLSLKKNSIPTVFDSDDVYVFDVDGSTYSADSVEYINVTNMDVNDEVDVNLRVTSNLNVSPKLCTEYNKENKSEIIETPKHKKRTTQSPNAMRKRKMFFQDFEVNDLNSPRRRLKYWKTSQNMVYKYKKMFKNLYNKNAWLRKRVKNLSNLVDHLKTEQKISDNCF